MSKCEYNPVNKGPAISDAPGNCENEATLSIGDGKWHLCDSCALLSEFNRFKIRRSLGGVVRKIASESVLSELKYRIGKFNADAESINQTLDDLGVPRKDEWGRTYSIHGRMCQVTTQKMESSSIDFKLMEFDQKMAALSGEVSEALDYAYAEGMKYALTPEQGQPLKFIQQVFTERVMTKFKQLFSFDKSPSYCLY